MQGVHVITPVIVILQHADAMRFVMVKDARAIIHVIAIRDVHVIMHVIAILKHVIVMLVVMDMHLVLVMLLAINKHVLVMLLVMQKQPQDVTVIIHAMHRLQQLQRAY